jgi:hypothetical protein
MNIVIFIILVIPSKSLTFVQILCKEEIFLPVSFIQNIFLSWVGFILKCI